MWTQFSQWAQDLHIRDISAQLKKVEVQLMLFQRTLHGWCGMWVTDSDCAAEMSGLGGGRVCVGGGE